ncbi:MAG: hypothetical protein RL154_956, partial [Pseudomonadota bacterium]
TVSSAAVATQRTPSQAKNPINFNALKEETSVAGSGIVETDSGEIAFSFSTKLRSSHANIKTSRVTDPLIIGLNGSLPDFSDKKTKFDLNADGKMDEISTLKQGAGFLAIDKNHNGKIDDGSELIGTTNGGFEELKALDSDNNGVIDENDAAYKDLKVWEKTDKKDSLKSLKDAGVGALFTDSVQNDYEYIVGGERKALLTASSFGINENGEAISLSQVQLTRQEVSQENSANQAQSLSIDASAQETSGKWVKGKSDTTDDEKSSTKDVSFGTTIKAQIARLETVQKNLNLKAQNSSSADEAKDFTQKASMIGGQISVLKASLFKIEKTESLDTTA